MTRLRLLMVLGACALLAVPAVADARPGKRGFNATYPHASRLCAKVAAGKAPKRLAGSTDQVSEACATLKTSFTTAQNDYNTATGPLKQQGVDALKALRATCQQARTDGTPGVCKTARQETRAKLKSLKGQIKEAAKAYHTAVQAARKTFWATIKSLRGGSSIEPDKTTPPAPTVALPTDQQVASA
jgi:hypothetical protein